MKRPAVDQLVYECMLPRPKPTDPHNFHGILTRYLVFEVRQEVHSFYGHLDTQEAKYPGLDYCHPIHRIRLGRWPWHRRLFRAFDHLRLTPAEIAHLTKWEGTRWAKERYEKEQGITILDTAADGMPDYRKPGSRLAELPARIDDYASLMLGSTKDEPGDSLVATGAGLGPAGGANFSAPQRPPAAAPAATGFDLDEAMQDVGESSTAAAAAAAAAADLNDTGEDSDDGVIQSIGLRLNERLRERVAAHNAGDTSLPLDEDWEQWLKNAIETGSLGLVSDHIRDLASLPPSFSSSSADNTTAASVVSGPGFDSDMRTTADSPELTFMSITPSQILHAARQGNWDEVPEFLHNVLRQTIEMEDSQAAAQTAAVDAAIAATATVAASATASHSSTSAAEAGRRRSPHSSTWHRTYSDLRLPASDTANRTNA